MLICVGNEGIYNDDLIVSMISQIAFRRQMIPRSRLHDNVDVSTIDLFQTGEYLGNGRASHQQTDTPDKVRSGGIGAKDKSVHPHGDPATAGSERTAGTPKDRKFPVAVPVPEERESADRSGSCP